MRADLTQLLPAIWRSIVVGVEKTRPDVGHYLDACSLLQQTW